MMVECSDDLWVTIIIWLGCTNLLVSRNAWLGKLVKIGRYRLVVGLLDVFCFLWITRKRHSNGTCRIFRILFLDRDCLYLPRRPDGDELVARVLYQWMSLFRVASFLCLGKGVHGMMNQVARVCRVLGMVGRRRSSPFGSGQVVCRRCSGWLL